MKNKLMNFVAKIMGSVAAMVIMVALGNANNTCIFWSYQPEVPEELLF